MAERNRERDVIEYSVTNAADSPWIHYADLSEIPGLERRIVAEQGHLKRYGVLAGEIVQHQLEIARFLIAD